MAKLDKTTASWCLYDWANSSFTTLVVTFVYATYFAKEIAPDVETGTLLWSRAVAASAVMTAVLSPVLGIVADRKDWRRLLLTVTTFLCVLVTAALAFVKPTQENAIVVSLTLFVFANVAYELGIVFYNAFLPQIVGAKGIGRMSGYGWGLGYAGGIVCLLLAYLTLTGETPCFGISTEEGFNLRAVNILVAGWFMVFSLPFIILAPSEKRPLVKGEVTKPFQSIKKTLRELGEYRELVTFLIAHLIYNDGLVTIFAFGGIYAAGTFAMSFSEIMLFGIVLNIAAGVGAVLFGFLDDKIGGKSIILISIAALSLATIAAVLSPNKYWFWCAGIGIGFFVGPNQSASRSLMGRFVPQDKRSEFFGFYTLSGKLTSFLGPIVLGLMTSAFHSQRAGVSSILLFFIAGGIVLCLVDEQQGIASGLKKKSTSPL